MVYKTKPPYCLSRDRALPPLIMLIYFPLQIQLTKRHLAFIYYMIIRIYEIMTDVKR